MKNQDYELTLEVDGREVKQVFASLVQDYGDPEYANYGKSDVADALPGLIAEGCKRHAGTLVDYDSYSSDSAYLDEIDRRVAGFAIVALGRPGPQERFLATALYSGDGGDWCDHVEAIDRADAFFQARWACAVNELDARGERTLTLKVIADEGFASEIDAIHVVNIQDGSMGTDAVMDVLQAVADAPGWATADRARAVLSAAGRPAKAVGTAPDDRTFAMVKSGAFGRGSADAILRHAMQAGFSPVRLKRERLERAKAEAFYAEHAGRPYYEGLIASVTDDEVVLMELQAPDAVAKWRAMIGPTDPAKAPAGTLRKEFGGPAMPDNAVHGSDSAISAGRELALMFEDRT